jgi:hypothetical protein
MNRTPNTIDCNIKTVNSFISWLTVKPNQLFGLLYKNPVANHYWTSGLPLIKLYIFAEHYDIPKLANDALRRFTSLMHLTGGKNKVPYAFAVDIEVFPTLDDISCIYRNIAAYSPFDPSSSVLSAPQMRTSTTRSWSLSTSSWWMSSCTCGTFKIIGRGSWV